MNDAFIISARRTPVSPVNGAYSNFNTWELAAPVIRDCLRDVGVRLDQVEEVWIGNGMYGGGNPARMVSLFSQIPSGVNAKTIDTQCCSGIDAIIAGIISIQSGARNIVIAGGVESISRSPLRFKRPLSKNMAPVQYSRPPFTPWPDKDPEMVEMAAELSKIYKISRIEQIQWAINSHKKGMEAIISNKNREELSLVPGVALSCDSFTRRLTESVGLRSKILSGFGENVVDSSTTSVSADAAGAVLIVSKEMLDYIKPSYKIFCRNFCQVGGDPNLPALSSVRAILENLSACSVNPQDIWASEIMEAYAVQALACVKETGLVSERVNLGGGALARGHPIGASGAILVVRLFTELKSAPIGAMGLAAIAAAGGLGTSLLLSVG